MSTDINLAIDASVKCLKKASACMVRRIMWAELENQKNGLTKIVLFTENNAE